MRSSSTRVLFFRIPHQNIVCISRLYTWTPFQSSLSSSPEYYVARSKNMKLPAVRLLSSDMR